LETFNEENNYIRYRTIHRNTDLKKYITSAQGMASSSAEMRCLLKVGHGLLASHDWESTELLKHGEKFGIRSLVLSKKFIL
jgi:hypothetical protein